MFLSIYPKRTKLISIDSKLYMLAKRKTVFFFSPVLLLWLEGFCYLCIRSPPLSEFLRFFVTILLPTVSNRWAFCLIIRLICLLMYNMWQYILNYKLKLVENRLLHSQMRICEIVEELGFTDESHLNKFFKKYRGCSPSNFRKNNLK